MSLGNGGDDLRSCFRTGQTATQGRLKPGSETASYPFCSSKLREASDPHLCAGGPKTPWTFQYSDGMMTVRQARPHGVPEGVRISGERSKVGNLALVQKASQHAP
jgi:hypothetical protein